MAAKDVRWRYRKRVISVTLLYCLGMIGYLTLYGYGESRLHSDIAGSLILLAGAVIGSYVFGSIADSDPEDGIYQDTELGTWEERRKVIFMTLMICGLGVGYFVVKGDDTTLNTTIANGLCLLAGSTVMSYVFGAVWDDKRLMQKGTAKKTTSKGGW